MGARERSLSVTLALGTILLLSAAVTAFDGYDGLPRPTGVATEPTATYGTKPQVTYNNKVASCTWYGFIDQNYNATETNTCLTLLWEAINASTGSQLAQLQAYTYYFPVNSNQYYDPQYQEYYCYVGCFKISTGPSPSPSVTPAPSPTNHLSPSPPTMQPPTSPPPPMMAPPPATLFRPPPPPPPMTPPVYSPAYSPSMETYPVAAPMTPSASIPSSEASPPMGSTPTASISAPAVSPVTQTGSGRILRATSGLFSLFVVTLALSAYVSF